VRKRNLPRRYAKDLLRRTRSNLFSKSIGWEQFLSLMEQKEATILRAYTTLCLSKSGTLQKNQILTSLKSAGLPANEDNAAAMIRYLNQDKDVSISYGHFRNFMLLLPSERLEEDPRLVFFFNSLLICCAILYFFGAMLACFGTSVYHLDMNTLPNIISIYIIRYRLKVLHILTC
jgi:hypothetical protein